MHDAADGVFADFGGELIDLVVAVDLDGLARGVDQDFAVIALGQMRANLFEQLCIDFVVEVIGHACEEIGTGHGSTLHDTDARRIGEGAAAEGWVPCAAVERCMRRDTALAGRNERFAALTALQTRLCASSSG